MSGKKPDLDRLSSEEVEYSCKKSLGDREKFEQLFTKLRDVGHRDIESDLDESLVSENHWKDPLEEAGESSGLNVETHQLEKDIDVSESMLLTNNIVDLTQHKIECLRAKLLELEYVVHSDEELTEIRQCITERRIIEESLIDIQNISPEASNFLRTFLHETDNIFEVKWKPRILDHINLAREELTTQISSIKDTAQEITSELAGELATMPNSSWSYISVGLKLLAGISIGVMGTLSLTKMLASRPEKLTTQSHPTKDQQETFTALPDPESRFLFMTSLKSKVNSFISIISHNTTHSLREPLSEIMAAESYDHLMLLIDLEQMLTYF